MLKIKRIWNLTKEEVKEEESLKQALDYRRPKEIPLTQEENEEENIEWLEESVTSLGTILFQQEGRMSVKYSKTSNPYYKHS